MNGTPLDNERYINLESFKKDGAGVKTPVWATPLGGKLVIFTEGSSYKVKRIRRNPKVRAAACDARGNVRGPWYDGECRIVEDPQEAARAQDAIRQKYGWQAAVANFFSKLTGRYDKRVILEVTVQGSSKNT